MAMTTANVTDAKISYLIIDSIACSIASLRTHEPVTQTQPKVRRAFGLAIAAQRVRAISAACVRAALAVCARECAGAGLRDGWHGRCVACAAITHELWPAGRVSTRDVRWHHEPRRSQWLRCVQLWGSMLMRARAKGNRVMEVKARGGVVVCATFANAILRSEP